MNNILVLGGGTKETAIATELGKKYNVMRFEKTLNDDVLDACDTIVLPLPAIEDNHITGTNIEFERLFKYPGKLIIGGKIPDFLENYYNEFDFYDYTKSEIFAVKNAVPTAEAAISIAIDNTTVTLHGSNCLITGYGRIAKVLARYLKCMGASVTCSIRNQIQIANAEADGFSVIQQKDITQHYWDLIFNTVPSVIFDEKVLLNLSAGIIIDLASMPGGCDFEAAKKLNINVIHALSLPGKTAPISAAKIIADTITILKE